MFKSIRKNKLKTALIVAAIFALLTVVVYYISYALGYGEYAVVIAVTFSLITSIASYWNSDKIVIAMNHAHPADEQQQRYLINALEGVCIAAGIDVPKLYVMDDPSPNAFATGRSPKHSAVCVTTGLLSTLDYYQLEGVLAHEVSHIKNYDILLSTVASVMIGAVIMISDIWSRSFWYGSRRRNSDNEKGSANAIMMIVGLVFIILAPVAGQLMRLALSRNREYLADATAVQLTRNPEGLATALEVIGGINEPVRCASTATANMYISDPILAANGRTSNLFATHPPIQKRIDAIRNLE